jgi:hypothetical protein
MVDMVSADRPGCGLTASLLLKSKRGTLFLLINDSPSPSDYVGVQDGDYIFAERYRGQAHLGIFKTVTTLLPTQSPEGDFQLC